MSEETNEQRDLRMKRNNMNCILSTVFMNMGRYGLTPDLRKLIEEHPCYLQGAGYDWTITMQDLAEYLFQIAGCVFSEPKEKTTGEAPSGE
jgi:hypothetical protein